MGAAEVEPGLAEFRLEAAALPPSERELGLSEMSSSPPSAPRLSPARLLYGPAPADDAEVRAAFEASHREELETMTAVDFERWMNTGEKPCPGSSGSGNGT